jgi:hypothetical protein
MSRVEQEFHIDADGHRTRFDEFFRTDESREGKSFEKSREWPYEHLPVGKDLPAIEISSPPSGPPSASSRRDYKDWLPYFEASDDVADDKKQDQSVYTISHKTDHSSFNTSNKTDHSFINRPPLFDMATQKPGLISLDNAHFLGTDDHIFRYNHDAYPAEPNQPLHGGGSSWIPQPLKNPPPSDTGAVIDSDWDRTVRCEHCGQGFTGRYACGNYARHIRLQHTSAVAPPSIDTMCRVCDKQFRRQDARRKHEWQKYGVPDAAPRSRDHRRQSSPSRSLEHDALEGESQENVLEPESTVLDVLWDHISRGNRGSHASSNFSSLYSYADSVFSAATQESSVTDLSKNSGYSEKQIARATDELVFLLQEDVNLVLLYKQAVADTNIGPDRLERNLRRLFRNYAELLGKAAGDTVEFLASRLVKAKARFVARSITQRYGPRPTFVENDNIVSEEKEALPSSEEEVDTNPVDENVFEDLVVFSEFLTSGEAFPALHAQIESFVLRKSTRKESIVPVTNDQADMLTHDDTIVSRIVTASGSVPFTAEKLVTAKNIEAITTENKKHHAEFTSNNAEPVENRMDFVQESPILRETTSKSADIVATEAGSQETPLSVMQTSNPDIQYCDGNSIDTRTSVGDVSASEGPATKRNTCTAAHLSQDLKNTMDVRLPILQPLIAFLRYSMIGLGYMEPPLRLEFVRLRWQCVSAATTLTLRLV